MNARTSATCQRRQRPIDNGSGNSLPATSRQTDRLLIPSIRATSSTRSSSTHGLMDSDFIRDHLTVNRPQCRTHVHGHWCRQRERSTRRRKRICRTLNWTSSANNCALPKGLLYAAPGACITMAASYPENFHSALEKVAIREKFDPCRCIENSLSTNSLAPLFFEVPKTV